MLTLEFMKKLLLLSISLGLSVVVFAQPHWHLDRNGLRDVAPDTVQTVSFPASIAKTVGGVWDFSALDTLGEAVISRLEVSGQTVNMVESETTFHFTAQAGGNYYSGWENDFKTVELHDPYNKLPYPLYPGRREVANYTASGLFVNTGIPTFITGKYELEVLDEGTILLPGGHERCAARCMKTIDSYTETGGGVTEVSIEKHLWYVPYYSFPLFVTTQVAYTYNDQTYDTLRTAYYTLNQAPQPAIRTINDTTICLGQSVEITATGRGNFYWRENTAGSVFQPFNNTVITPETTLSYIFMAEDEQCSSQPAFDTLTIYIDIAPTLVVGNRDIVHCARTLMYLHAASNMPLQWFERNDYGELIPVEDAVYPEKSTVYIVQAGNSCLTLTDSVNVSVIAVEAPELTILSSGKDVIFDIENYAANLFNYSLNFGDGSPSDYRPMSLHHYSAAGSYTAVLTLTGKQTGCEAAFDYPIVIDEQESNPLIIYPNPAHYVLNVIAPEEILFYRIVDVSGQNIYKYAQCSGSETGLQIDVLTLPVNAYVLQVQTRSGWLSHTFIKAQ